MENKETLKTGKAQTRKSTYYSRQSAGLVIGGNNDDSKQRISGQKFIV